MRLLINKILLLCLILTPSILYSDEMKLNNGVPRGILNRVFKFKYKNKTGSSFVFDIEGKQYLITAKHLTPNISDGDKIELFHFDKWHEFKIKPIFCDNEYIDIIALAPDKAITKHLEIETGTPFFGQDVIFLGFPLREGLASFSKTQSWNFPFIKKAILSAVDNRHNDAAIFYLDGHNNGGFSGGPIIFGNVKQNKKLTILGVISGYKYEPKRLKVGELKPNKKTNQSSTKNLVPYFEENTGIIIAYHIDEIIKAIKSNPIGYPVEEK